MSSTVPVFIADCKVDEIDLFLFEGNIGEKVEICPGCFKKAPYGYDEGCNNNQSRFLDYEDEVYSKEYCFQKESTFKRHLSKCSNGFDINSDSHIFEVTTPKQKKIAHIMGKFSKAEQKIDHSMTYEYMFENYNFRTFVSTHDFRKGENYKKTPIGYVSVMMRDNKEFNMEIPVIEDIFVFKKFRGNGIASELIDHVIKEYNIDNPIGVQFKISPAFRSLLKKKFDYISGYLGFQHSEMVPTTQL